MQKKEVPNSEKNSLLKTLNITIVSKCKHTSSFLFFIKDLKEVSNIPRSHESYSRNHCTVDCTLKFID